MSLGAATGVGSKLYIGSTMQLIRSVALLKSRKPNPALPEPGTTIHMRWAGRPMTCSDAARHLQWEGHAIRRAPLLLKGPQKIILSSDFGHFILKMRKKTFFLGGKFSEKNVKSPTGAPNDSTAPQFQFSPRISANFANMIKRCVFVKKCRKKNIKMPALWGHPTCDGGGHVPPVPPWLRH